MLTCRACGEAVTEKEVAARWGPSGSWPRSVPEGSTRRRSSADGKRGQAGLFPETMSVFGNRWAAALLVCAFLGTSRFSDFQTQLGAPPSLLSGRLQTFCANGVLCTSREATLPAHREGAGVLPGHHRRAAVRATLVSCARGPGGAAHPPRLRQAVRRAADLRPVRPAAEGRTGQRRLARAARRQRPYRTQRAAAAATPPTYRP